ncbi:MAG: aminotransferase, partial [Gammaproteobacteria bacterium]|nr:aminotransferase [Gammaproteobacteria bacterium]
LTDRAMKSWGANENIELLGNPDPSSRVGIISFNIRNGSGKYLHHKFITALLNDLFGIQSRAGCSCAGPYGHRLLDIDENMSERYRFAVQQGHCGLKPGWCRVGLHWVMDDAEANYVIDAVHFLAREGSLFLSLYDFDLGTGTWKHKYTKSELPEFSLDEAISADNAEPAILSLALRRQLYKHYLTEAKRIADRLRVEPATEYASLEGDFSDLQFFVLRADDRRQH